MPFICAAGVATARRWRESASIWPRRGPVLCELCCPEGEDRALRSRRVRGPGVGPGIRILARHAA